MGNLITFDFNGWLDFICDHENEIRTLGFRSCLWKHDNQYLIGAQALAAARYTNSVASTEDAYKALESLTCSVKKDCNLQEKLSLPSVLWSMVQEASMMSGEAVNLALIIPDNQVFGNTRIVDDGKTHLEILYQTLNSTKPPNSRIFLIWRSVAVLHAALNKTRAAKEGVFLVASVNSQVSCSVLEFKNWENNRSGVKSLQIVRIPMTDHRDNFELESFNWLDNVSESVKFRHLDGFDSLRKSTRWIEIHASHTSSLTLEELGIDTKAIEHLTWTDENRKPPQWHVNSEDFGVEFEIIDRLIDYLGEKVEKFLVRQRRQQLKPLAVVVENPVSDEFAEKLAPLEDMFRKRIKFIYISGAEAIEAARELAGLLSDPNHQNWPAWLDSVPEIRIEVRKEKNSAHEEDTEWKSIVPENEAIPAGELYVSPLANDRRITLAPGTESVRLHLQRENEERYTALGIFPSDHERVVEPVARVRPLSEVARIEIVEHHRDGRNDVLAGPVSGIRWDELEIERPKELKLIPELYIFQASKEGWNNLKPILHQIVQEGANETLREELYNCTQSQWKNRIFPLGSDGQPPRVEGEDYSDSQRVLKQATNLVLQELENYIDSPKQIGKSGTVNRLHLGLTWLFTGCPERVTKILLEAINKPNEGIGKALLIEKERFSAWAINSGVGRTVQSEEDLKIIYDTLIGRWEEAGGQSQDKFLLAAVTHPAARRVAVRRVLNDDYERFERVKRFLDQQLDNLLAGKNDTRPNGKEPLVEARYVTMGYRGLCQVRYENIDWFPPDCGNTRSIYKKFISLKNSKIIATQKNNFVRELIDKSAPYLIGEGIDPSMPGGF